MPIGGNGPNVGTCNNETKTCDIRAWCPTEYENETITHSAPLIDASNFTVLIKNSIRYPALLPNDRKRNILPVDEGTNYLRKCNFSTNSYENLYCPIMSLQYIVDNIVHSDQDFTELSILGGVVGIEIRWDCDLDWKLKHCNPKYTFRRLDDPNVGVSPGFNFRFANYYVEDGAQARTLYKAYGILFKVVTIGKGGMFDFTTLVLKIGSMIALLGIAVVVSDVIVLYVLKKRNFYKQNKYQQVIDSDDDKEYEVINNPPDVETPATKRVNYSSNSSSPQESDKF
jgi:P2X purinoceptor 4